jgi:hypothetical protein
VDMANTCLTHLRATLIDGNRSQCLSAEEIKAILVRGYFLFEHFLI